MNSNFQLPAAEGCDYMPGENSISGEINLTLPSDSQVLALIRKITDSICRQAHFSDDETMAVVQSVYEACTNVIVHAHQRDVAKPLEVSFQFSGEIVQVQIRDHGPPFDLNHLPQLDPAEARPGGRGVFLMRRLMDEVTSGLREGGGNEVKMIKTKSPPTLH